MLLERTEVTCEGVQIVMRFNIKIPAAKKKKTNSEQWETENSLTTKIPDRAMQIVQCKLQEEWRKSRDVSRTSTSGSHVVHKGLLVALLAATSFLGFCLIQSMDLDSDSHLSLSSADGRPAHPLADISRLGDPINNCALTAGTFQLFIGRRRWGGGAAQITCLQPLFMADF